MTAAHEYFHAVQFGYDVCEDGWVMEATATWAEDELYDEVNDNVQYLPGGPMSLPEESIDQFSGGFHYGTWIFFRYLTERFPNSEGGMPILVRDLWRRLDDAAGGADEYSLQGLKQVLGKRDLSLRRRVRRLLRRQPHARAVATTRAGQPLSARPAGPQATLTPRTSAAPRWAHARPPGRGHRPLPPAPACSTGDWHAPPQLDLQRPLEGQPARSSPPAARAAPGLQRSKTRLNKQGNGARSFGFSRGSVRYVEVTLVNASDKFECSRGTRFSCKGKPKFDNSVAADQRAGVPA